MSNPAHAVGEATACCRSSHAVCTWEGAGPILLFCFCLSGNNEISQRLEIFWGARGLCRSLFFFSFFLAVLTTVFACIIYSRLAHCIPEINQPPRGSCTCSTEVLQDAYVVLDLWIIHSSLYMQYTVYWLELLSTLIFYKWVMTQSFRRMLLLHGPSPTSFLQHIYRSIFVPS